MEGFVIPASTVLMDLFDLGKRKRREEIPCKWVFGLALSRMDGKIPKAANRIAIGWLLTMLEKTSPLRFGCK
jgi:hypothetical protein